MNLQQLSKILNGKLHGESVDFTGVSIDSRTLKLGELYIAIRGEKFDGHDFVEDAKKQGAAAAVTSYEVSTTLPQVCVENTRTALVDLASFYRQKNKMPFLAITGSCGKTTTRAMLENILKLHGKVLASQRSFNNDIGVPLTLLKLKPEHKYVVIEMGANHPGEIAKLTHIVQPTVAIITNAGSAHLAGFGDIAGVACAKGEIFQGLDDHGTAVINQDDAYANFWKKQVGDHAMITFGMLQSADVMAHDIQSNPQSQSHFELQLPNAKTQVQLPLMGEHNVMNALAAAAAAFVLDIPVDIIKQGLETVEAVSARLVAKKGFSGAMIIDDSYNANPTSVSAAIRLLSKRPGVSVLVLGDMLELGDATNTLHKELGEFALQSGVDQLFCYGEHSEHTAKAFGKNASHFDNQSALIKSVKAHLSDDMTVLVKGSFSMNMAQVAEALMDK